MEERLKQMLSVALCYGVTDIHFALYHTDQHVSIEMRIGSKMRKLKEVNTDAQLFHYLMYRANLDISNAFQPQTGSFQLRMDDKTVSLRFAIVTSYSLTSGVLRILNNHTDLRIEDLTYQSQVQQWLQQITTHRYGLYLLSGPTSSGKTTTLYTILNQTKDKKIYTLEDPIEVVSDRYIQLQVNEAQHLSYAEGIKQLMRHDPDIVMIGEIRDEEAAMMVVRCALTGHLVISTIHSSSCMSAIVRMLDLGVKEYELKDVLKGVSNQRLFSLKGNQRTGIYEVMDQKEVKYYFDHSQTSMEFETEAQAIQRAVHEGILRKEDCEEDMLI